METDPGANLLSPRKEGGGHEGPGRGFLRPPLVKLALALLGCHYLLGWQPGPMPPPPMVRGQALDPCAQCLMVCACGA